MEINHKCILDHKLNFGYFPLPCKHLICPLSLLHSLFKEHLRELQYSSNIQFKCENHMLLLSLSQIKDILNQMLLNINLEPRVPTICLIHRRERVSYCYDCHIEICRSCHTQHMTSTRKELIGRLARAPPIGILNEIEKMESLFQKDFVNCYNRNRDSREDKNFEEITQNYLQHSNVLYERGCLILKIIRLLHINYYSFLYNISADLSGLISFNQIKLFLPKIQLYTTSTQKDKKSSQKIELKLSFNEIPYGNFKCASTLTGHTFEVNALIQLKDQRLLSGSYDFAIKVWELKGNNVFSISNSLSGHTNFVLCLVQLEDGRIASGSADQSIKIWESRDTTFICTQTLFGHESFVMSLVQLKNGSLASGSLGGGIKIWECGRYGFTCVLGLNGYYNSIMCLIQLKDGRLAAGSKDSLVNIWEMKGKPFINICLFGHTDWICCLLQLDDSRIASGSYDKAIKIWKIRENTVSCSHTLHGHIAGVSSLLQLKDGRMLSGSIDNTIKIWEISQISFICTQTLTGHTNRVNVLLELNDGRLASGSADRTIRLWKEERKISHECYIY